jgi:hypothetical protein
MAMVGYACLTPLLTIIKTYSCLQFYWCPWKKIRPSRNHRQTLLHTVYLNALHYIRSIWMHFITYGLFECTPCFSEFRVAQSLVFFVVFCWPLICLSVLFLPLSFQLRFLITHLISANISCDRQCYLFIRGWMYTYFIYLYYFTFVNGITFTILM